MATVKLLHIAHSRTGDKGDTLNFSLIPYNEKDYASIAEQVTSEKVKDHLQAIIKGEVIRYDLPTLHAFNFVCTNALLGGVTTSIAWDAHGKSISSALLEMEINI